MSPRVGDAPPVNSAPVFPTTETGQREVAEDATGSTNIGDPVAATDFNNSADTLYYSLSGTDAEFFTIDSGTGQLRLAQGVTLDYEGKRSVPRHGGSQRPSGPARRPRHGDRRRQSVTVTVTNVNEAPVVTGVEAASFDGEL